jgi:hypothetical protein
MASRSDWDALREGNEDDEQWDDAVDDLDRDFEHSEYYAAQRRANAANGDDEDEVEDDLDALHARADRQEAERAAACESVDAISFS